MNFLCLPGPDLCGREGGAWGLTIAGEQGPGLAAGWGGGVMKAGKAASPPSHWGQRLKGC